MRSRHEDPRTYRPLPSTPLTITARPQCVPFVEPNPPQNLRALFARDVMNTPVVTFREKERVGHVLDVLRSWCAQLPSSRSPSLYVCLSVCLYTCVCVCVCGGVPLTPDALPAPWRSTHNGFPVVRPLGDAEKAIVADAPATHSDEPICVGIILRNQLATLIRKGAYFDEDDTLA